MLTLDLPWAIVAYKQYVGVAAHQEAVQVVLPKLERVIVIDHTT